MIRLLFLWMDQWMVRLWYLLIPFGALVVLFNGYAGEITGLYAGITALWATYDIARGIVFNYDFERESIHE